VIVRELITQLLDEDMEDTVDVSVGGGCVAIEGLSRCCEIVTEKDLSTIDPEKLKELFEAFGALKSSYQEGQWNHNRAEECEAIIEELKDEL